MHVDSPLIPLIKSNQDTKSEKDCVEIKLRRYPTSEKSYIYEFKMGFFDNGKPEVFLLFVRNFKMTLEAPGEISADAKI